MLPHTSLYVDQWSQQQFNEVAGLTSTYGTHIMQSSTDHRMEVSDRKEWLILLGISESYAHDLAVHTMEQPLFSLAYFQQHWKELRLNLGNRRQDEADAIVLREIRELLQTSTPQAAGRTPSPPRNLNWGSYHSRLSDKSRLENCTESPINSPNIYNPEQRRASTPVNDLEPDVYNINADPRNVEYYQPTQLQAFDYNYNINSASKYQNCYNVNVGPCYTNDGVQQTLLNQPVGYTDAYPNNYISNITYSNANYQEGLQNNYLYFNGKANELEMQNANNLQFQNDVNNGNYAGVSNSDWKTYGNQQRNDLNDQTSFDNCLPSNAGQTAKEQTWRRDRKRSAGRQGSAGNDQIDRKRRYVETQENVFKIGSFKMPKIVFSTEPLPQPEEDSHAIRFFRMNHCFIVGGGAAPKTNAKARAQLSFPPNYNRSIAKRIRLNVRNEWMTIYRKMNYKNWYNWWNAFKWCGEGIDSQLLRFRGINLEKNSFLYCKLSYDNREEVTQLLHLARTALEFNKTNYQSVLCTIFEMMNRNFLNALTLEDIGKVQDMIRHMPNHLWLYKMRSMVYLWSRYSRIQNNTDNAAPQVHSKELVATKSQWNSALFHWLAKQAYDEVKRISSREWSDHKKTFSLRQ